MFIPLYFNDIFSYHCNSGIPITCIFDYMYDILLYLLKKHKTKVCDKRPDKITLAHMVTSPAEKSK